MSLISENITDINTWNKTTNESGLFYVSSRTVIKLKRVKLPVYDYDPRYLIGCDPISHYK